LFFKIDIFIKKNFLVPCIFTIWCISGLESEKRRGDENKTSWEC